MVLFIIAITVLAWIFADYQLTRSLKRNIKEKNIKGIVFDVLMLVFLLICELVVTLATGNLFHLGLVKL
jgi:hypothetical protein